MDIAPAPLHLCVLTDGTEVHDAVADLSGPSCRASCHSLRAVVAGTRAGGLLQELREGPECYDAFLFAWDALDALLIGALCYQLRTVRGPLIALCRESEADRVAALAVGADTTHPLPPSIPLLRAQVAAHRRVRGDRDVERVHPDLGAWWHAPPPKTLRVGPVAVDRDAHTVRVHDHDLAVTPRQLAVLAFLMEHAGELLTRDRILSEVWGIDFDTGTNLVDVHVHYLRQMLAAHGVTDVIRTVRGRGYRLEPHPTPGHVAEVLAAWWRGPLFLADPPALYGGGTR